MDYKGDLATPAIAEPEVDYLAGVANRYFASDLARSDVAWTFAGLRPLLADPKDRATSVTRDYVLDLDTQGRAAAVDLRRQADDLPQARRGRAWTSLHRNRQPGWPLDHRPPSSGRRPATRRLRRLSCRRSRRATRGCPPPLLQRYARAYGSRAERICAAPPPRWRTSAKRLPACTPGKSTTCGAEEWAVTADDILYRRSKLALHVPADGPARLEAWLASNTRRSEAAGAAM